MRIKWIRKSHRWLGLFIGIQLLLWTASGLYFSWNDIEAVRGEHLMTEPPLLAPTDTALAAPGVALVNLAQAKSGVEGIDQVVLRMVDGQPVYEMAYLHDGATRYALADARTGRLRAALTEAQAVALAEADFVPEAPVHSVERVSEAPSGSEFRGVTLPAYRVAFDHPTNTRLYVSVDRGRVMARRNDTWRLFDFLWALHIMDYDARDDFNHWLLQAFSVLGVVTVLSGFALGGVTSPWLRGRRKKKRPRQKVTGTRPAELS